jgi:AcrR family transcriptional regulator
MPKQTFLNLPEAKRKRLVSIAIEEFAGNDYESASVSRIVARVGIAKGSIYQYFEDKRDLYLHLVVQCSRVLLEAVSNAGAPPDGGDVFHLIRWQMSATVRAAAAHPLHARVLERAYSAQTPLGQEIRAQGAATSEDHFTPLILAAAERGEINPDLDPGVVTFVIRAVMNGSGRYLAASLGLDPDLPDPEALVSDEAERVFDEIVEALRSGLSPARAPAVTHPPRTSSLSTANPAAEVRSPAVRGPERR